MATRKLRKEGGKICRAKDSNQGGRYKTYRTKADSETRKERGTVGKNTGPHLVKGG